MRETRDELPANGTGLKHELNNLLSAILGNVTLALRSDLVPDVERYLGDIREAARRAAQLTRGLADDAVVGLVPGAGDGGGGGGGPVLIVDDDRSARSLLAMMLRGLGRSPIEASTIPEALALMEERGQAVEAAVVAASLPQLPGREFHETLRLSFPGVRVILTSEGDEAAAIGRMVVPRGVFLRKPFTIADVARSLQP